MIILFPFACILGGILGVLIALQPVTRFIKFSKRLVGQVRIIIGDLSV